MINAEFVVRTGEFQHVKLTVSGVDAADFGQRLAEITDLDKASLGRFQAELESWVKDVYEKLADGQLEEAQKLIQNALGSTVIESIPHKPTPVQDASTPVWKQTPATTQPAPWKAQASTEPKKGRSW